MILDGLLTFDFGTVIPAAGGPSANTIDLLQNRDLGLAEVSVYVTLGSTLAGGTLQVQVQTSTDNATWNTIVQSGTVQPGQMGAVFRGDLPVGVQRFLRLNYVCSGITSGTVSAGLTKDGPDSQGQPYYPRNFQS